MWRLVCLLFSFIQLIIASGPENNCTILKADYAKSSSEFLFCAIANSTPITFCENCLDYFMNITKTYNTMKQVVDSDGTHCLDKFVNLDTLEIVQNSYTVSYNLWNTASCDDCFKIVNGSVTPNVTEEVMTFNEKYDQYSNCVHQKGINDSTLCPLCMDSYLELDNYYKSLSKKTGVCMDIVDKMNRTRTFWSPRCCKYRRHDESIFIASTAVVLMISLCFYAFTHLCSEKLTPTILQQTRLAESLNNVNH